MHKLIPAVFGLGALIAGSAYADHFAGSNASAHEVRTPQSVNDNDPSATRARGRDSQSVYHPGHTPRQVDDSNPAGTSVGATRSDRVGATARSNSYSLFGMRFSNPEFPRSVDDSAPWRTNR